MGQQNSRSECGLSIGLIPHRHPPEGCTASPGNLPDCGAHISVHDENAEQSKERRDALAVHFAVFLPLGIDKPTKR